MLNGDATWLLIGRIVKSRKLPPAFRKSISELVGDNHLGTVDELRAMAKIGLIRRVVEFYDKVLVPAAKSGRTTVHISRQQLSAHIPSLIIDPLRGDTFLAEQQRLHQITSPRGLTIKFAPHKEEHDDVNIKIDWSQKPLKAMPGRSGGDLLHLAEQLWDHHPDWLPFHQKLIDYSQRNGTQWCSGGLLRGYFNDLDLDSLVLLLGRKGLRAFIEDMPVSHGGTEDWRPCVAELQWS